MMRKDTPVSPQPPEWKKEVAEKVKAYGERKKRLTTPPYRLKENQETQQPDKTPIQPDISLAHDPEQVSPEPRAKAISNEGKQVLFAPVETAAQPDVEVWIGDIQGLPGQEKESEEAGSSTGPYLLRRVFAGMIDLTMLAVLTIVILYGFSFVTGESIQWVILSKWKGALSLFLLMHFTYQLYFFRATRQTPGMLFVSLELRDPVIPVIPVGKIIVRWFAFVLLNIFNALPVMLGKNFLLLDQLSGTEMRSFK